MRPILLYLTPTLLNETKVTNLNKLQNTHVNAISFHMAHFKLQNTHVNAISFHMAHFKLQNTHVNAISFHMAHFKLIVFINGLF